jgi:hypothetical protein
MSTSIRIDTTEWLPGCVLIGDTGGGVRGSDIPSSGTSGPGYAYNDLSLPADANKEICGRITSWPSAGNLFAREDTSFDFTGAPDGVYTFQYQLYVDYVPVGSPTTVTLTVGGGSATVAGQTLSASASLIAGSASGAIGATVTGQLLTLTASLQPGAASGGGAASVSGQVLAAVASLLPGTASGSSGATVEGKLLNASVSMLPGMALGVGGAVVPGQVLTAIASVIAGMATGSGFARAPDGNGYPPRRSNTVRPAMVRTRR